MSLAFTLAQNRMNMFIFYKYFCCCNQTHRFRFPWIIDDSFLFVVFLLFVCKREASFIERETATVSVVPCQMHEKCDLIVILHDYYSYSTWSLLRKIYFWLFMHFIELNYILVHSYVYFYGCSANSMKSGISSFICALHLLPTCLVDRRKAGIWMGCWWILRASFNSEAASRHL